MKRAASQITVISTIRFALCVLGTLILSGCSSKVETSTLRLALPDWNQERSAAAYTQSKLQALNVVYGQSVRAQMTRIMINVTGPGVGAKQILIWEAKDVLGAQPAASDLEFEIQSGTKALIQVMAITRDFTVDDASGDVISRGDEEVFYYGDVDHLVTPGSQNVNLTVRALNFGNGREGEIAGRYLPVAGSVNGPTGKVQMKYHPATRPNNPMTLMETEIHGGWFNFFGLEGAGFTYWLEDGTELFPGTIAQTDKLPPIATSPAVPYQVRAQLPAGYFANGSAMREERDARFLIGGYFGAGAPTKKVCFDGNANEFNQNYYSAAAGGTYLNWRGRNIATSSADGGVLAGGDDSAGCMNAPQSGFDDFLYLAEKTWLKRRPAFEFRGPFRYLTSSTDHDLLSVARDTVTSGNLQLKWHLLPGVVGNDRVDSIGFFTRVLNDVPSGDGERDFKADDQIKCDQLESLGFTNVTRISAAVEANDSELSIGPVDLDAFTEGRMDVIICPHGPKGYYRSGLAFRKEPQLLQASNLRLALLDDTTATTAGSAVNLPKSVCLPMVLSARDVDGDLGYLPPGTQHFSINTGASTALYSDPSCLQSLTGASNIYILAARNPQVFYMKTTDSTGNVLPLYANESSGTLAVTQFLYTAVNSTTATRVVTHTASVNRKYDCNVLTYQTTDASGMPALANNRTLALRSTPGLTFYADDYCLVPYTTGSVQFPSTGYASSFPLRYKYTGSDASTVVSPLGTLPFDIPAVPKSVILLAPSTPKRVAMFVASSLQLNQCHLVEVSLVDSNSRRTPTVMAALPVNLQIGTDGGGAPAGVYYDNANCDSGTSITTTSIPAGQTSKFVYLKPSYNTSGLQLGAAPSSSASALQSSTITVSTHP